MAFSSMAMAWGKRRRRNFKPWAELWSLHFWYSAPRSTRLHAGASDSQLFLFFLFFVFLVWIESVKKIGLRRADGGGSVSVRMDGKIRFRFGVTTAYLSRRNSNLSRKRRMAGKIRWRNSWTEGGVIFAELELKSAMRIVPGADALNSSPLRCSSPRSKQGLSSSIAACHCSI